MEICRSFLVPDWNETRVIHDFANESVKRKKSNEWDNDVCLNATPKWYKSRVMILRHDDETINRE